MELKYGGYSYQSDDFAQRGDEMVELTVTITLDEYRRLISENVSMSVEIDSFKRENKTLTERIEALQKAVATTIPPSLIKGLAGWASQFSGADEAEDAEEQEESDE